MKTSKLIAAAALLGLAMSAAAQPSGMPGAAPQPDAAQQNRSGQPDNPQRARQRAQNRNRQQMNRTGRNAAQRGRAAQFDARLMTAINTVQTLVEIAPNTQAEQQLEQALGILREVQNSTETESLGPGNATQENGAQQNNSEQRGPPANRNQRRGPPGFVASLIGGLFG